jgi:hypothetical protein
LFQYPVAPEMSSDVLTLPVGWLFIAGPPATPEDPTLAVARASRSHVPTNETRSPLHSRQSGCVRMSSERSTVTKQVTRDRYKKQSPLESTHSRSPSHPPNDRRRVFRKNPGQITLALSPSACRRG